MAGVWTNNWKGIKNAMLTGGDMRSGWSTVKNLTGTTLTGSFGSNLGPMNQYINQNSATSSNNNSRNNVIVFGTGNGTPDASDYCLGAKWTANISRVSLSEQDSLDSTTHTKTKTVTCTVQNTGSSAVTIREWGIECYTSGQVLLYRALLDTPVTLAQYESATFTCTISLRLTDPG